MKRTLIITGGSAGIGAATARVFLSGGWEVLSLARRPCLEPGARSVVVDLAAEGWERVVEREALPLVGPGVLCLVHNAATHENDDALSLPTERLRAILEVNIIAPAALNRLFSPLMRPGSSILYVGSTLSEKAVRQTASYVTSKHALVGLMRATCQDAAGRGIHTACVCPGFVDTELLRSHARRGGGDGDAVMKVLAAMSGHGRLIEAEEIGELLRSCAEQPVIDGAVLHANLGQRES